MAELVGERALDVEGAGLKTPGDIELGTGVLRGLCHEIHYAGLAQAPLGTIEQHQHLGPQAPGTVLGHNDPHFAGREFDDSAGGIDPDRLDERLHQLCLEMDIPVLVEQAEGIGRRVGGGMTAVAGHRVIGVDNGGDPRHRGNLLP